MLRAVVGPAGTVPSVLPVPDPFEALRRRARSVRRRVAALPVTPAKAADAAMGRFFDRRRAAAHQDPTWAAIEARRETGGPSKIFLSADAGLGFPEHATQERIEEELVPDPWWLPLAARARHWHLSRVPSKVRHHAQRARRGWSVPDTWSAGHHLAEVTAGMLEHLAEHSTGWPSSEEFPTFEDWTAALRRNAQLLRTWLERPGADAALNDWYAAACDPDARPGAAKRLSDEMHQLEESQTEGAQEAMRWVAEHLPALWD